MYQRKQLINYINQNSKPKSVIRISLCRTAKRNPNDRFGINFARLWGPKRFIEILVAEYARLRKFDEQEAIGIAMYSRRKFWTRYRKRHKVKFKLEL